MAPPSTATRSNWPPDYVSVWKWRQRQLLRLRQSDDLLAGALEYYAQPEHAVEFINHWLDTYDPRNAGRETPARMPFILFERQAELIEFIFACINAEADGLAEKARDMGATWVCGALSVWLWRFYPGASVGWGSRKEQLVDKIGDPDSIFEKIRMLIRSMPREFWPAGFSETDHMAYMRIVNPESGATITGEAGDNIGRGGRKLIYFKDEAAHYERPEKIEAALADNTRVQIDISSVNGLGNVFHRKRESGVEWQPGSEAVAGRTNVFVMDWRDHPAKDGAWYERRRQKAEDDGLLHVFAQEVERNYAASVEGLIIRPEWVEAAIDADQKLGFQAEGGRIAGLDVADDGGGDLNALALRQGVVLLAVDEWGGIDTSKTTNRAVEACSGHGAVEINYDSIGVGAGVKGEANRLKESGQLPAGITFKAWSAADAPLFPDKPIEPLKFGDDKNSVPLNKDFYANLKAQGWWQLRRRFEKTYRAVVESVDFPADELISIPSTLPKLVQLKKELCQPTAGKTTGTQKLIVNKKPDGTRSPNIADAVMMAFWPIMGTPQIMVSDAALKRARMIRRR